MTPRKGAGGRRGPPGGGRGGRGPAEDEEDARRRREILDDVLATLDRSSRGARYMRYAITIRKNPSQRGRSYSVRVLGIRAYRRRWRAGPGGLEPAGDEGGNGGGDGGAAGAEGDGR